MNDQINELGTGPGYRPGVQGPNSDWDALLAQIEREAEAEGPEAVKLLRARQEKYRVMAEEIKVLRTILAIAGQNHLLPMRRIEEIEGVAKVALKQIVPEQ